MVRELREYSDVVLGNLVGIQTAFGDRIFAAEYRSELERVCLENAARAKHHFGILQETLAGSRLIVKRRMSLTRRRT